MRILKEDTIAVVVDIQEKLFPHMMESENLAVNCLKLISGLKVLEVPFLVTEQYTAGLGKTIPAIREAIAESYYPVEKLDFSCCGSVDFLGKLNDSAKKTVILFGIESHVCVLQTALDLLENRLLPVIVSDCVSSRKSHDKTTALERMKSEGCIITTYESILLELCKVAGTDRFKAISKIIR